MLDSRPKGRGFEPHRRHCVVSLSKMSKNINPSLVLVQPRKTRPFITERLLMGRKESNQTNKDASFWFCNSLNLSAHSMNCSISSSDPSSWETQQDYHSHARCRRSVPEYLAALLICSKECILLSHTMGPLEDGVINFPVQFCVYNHSVLNGS